MKDLKYSFEHKGVEVGKILSLKRAGLLTEQNIGKYIKRDEAKNIAFALANEKPDMLSSDYEKSVFHALLSL